MPFYFEQEDFIGVHASVQMGDSGVIMPFHETPYEEFVYSRMLNGKDVLPKSSKCIICGRTPVKNIAGEDMFLYYPRSLEVEYSHNISDYYKIHIDAGVYLEGVLGWLCVDD